MIIQGDYGEAIIFTDKIEEGSLEQIKILLKQKAFEGSKIRIMPDVHVGKGCVIGFTADLGKRIIPNIVGVDIGCGMETVLLGKNIKIDFEKLDKFIRDKIPFGYGVNKRPIKWISRDIKEEISEVSKKIDANYMRCIKSLGSLGGGNHFIEVNKGKDEEIYLVIHSGSRGFGNQVAKYYQKRAEKYCANMMEELNYIIDERVKEYKKNGDLEKINCEYEKKKNYEYNVPRLLSFLEGEDAEEYLKDMKLAQEYAELNRIIMTQKIVEFLGLDYDNLEKFTTIHNYIEHDTNIVRKGAISAKRDEKILIPINMRDGSILAIGKGSEEWNNSAPHGAGRLYSRTGAKEKFDIEEFEKEMEEVWSTSVRPSTLDESPMAYKPIKDILDNIEDTAKVIDIIKPIYNFKA